MRWRPVTTFVQNLVDMKNAQQPGSYRARGHDYRPDLPRFLVDVYGLDVTPGQLARVEEALRLRETVRERLFDRPPADRRPPGAVRRVRSSGSGEDGRRRAAEAVRRPPAPPAAPGGAMTQTAPDNALGRIAAGDAPVLEELLAMNLDAAERSGLDAETYLLVRLAALVAMDAAPVSYLITLGAAAETDLSVERIQGVLVAIAPVVGSARVTAAAGAILRGVLGAEALAESVVPQPRSS